MKNIKFLLIPLTLVALFLSGCQVTPPSRSPQTDRSEDQPSQTQKNTAVSIRVNGDEDASADDSLVEDSSPDTLVDVLNTPPVYTDYSPEAFAELKGQRPVVLFFHADWCPVCRVMDKNIRDEIATYPMGTNILKVNYDDETGLKKQYNVKIQSTVVVLDAEGTVIYSAQDPAMDDFRAAIEASISGS